MEDDVDMESLQAQIDMSMSFAHNLVTSWIKPTRLAQLRPGGVNATQVLEEELRRPPRLGVGASIPTAPPLAHEASKLKRRFGKPEAKDECAVESRPQDSSKSDDEEYKGRPSKRKAKADPFGYENKKKKRKAKCTADPSAESVSKHPVSLSLDLAPGELSKHNPCSRQERQRMGPEDRSPHATEEQRLASLVSSPLLALPVQTTFSPSVNVHDTPSLLEPSRGTSAPVPGIPTTSESGRVHINYLAVPNKAKTLGIPLLNLDGPPEFTNGPGNTSGVNNFRKKRKKRKKKKNQMSAGTGDN